MSKKKKGILIACAVVAVLVVIYIVGVATGIAKPETEDPVQQAEVSSQESEEPIESEASVPEVPEVTVADFSTMTKEQIQEWATENNVTCQVSDAYSDSVESGKFVSQSVAANESVEEGGTIQIVFSKGKEPSTEFKNALRQAESYSEYLHLSKQGIYDQLTSEYGGQFEADAAQYAIDNIEADWNANALEQAKSYQETMGMSKNAIYDQLISEYGGQFTEEEAQYAIDHLDD